MQVMADAGNLLTVKGVNIINVKLTSHINTFKAKKHYRRAT
jgi:hypothetical protein